MRAYFPLFYVLTDVKDIYSLLLDHMRKFPVSATGGLMLAKYEIQKCCMNYLTSLVS
jgi:hypothetical protein